MALKLERWDSAEQLRTEEEIVRYWDACLEKGRDDAAFMTAALDTIARARELLSLARGTGRTTSGGSHEG